MMLRRVGRRLCALRPQKSCAAEQQQHGRFAPVHCTSGSHTPILNRFSPRSILPAASRLRITGVGLPGSGSGREHPPTPARYPELRPAFIGKVARASIASGEDCGTKDIRSAKDLPLNY
jgi:hypothetical protein